MSVPAAWEVQAEVATSRVREEDDRQLTARIMALLPTKTIVGPGMKGIIETVDTWLDGEVAPDYKNQPLAQDWARVAKLAEEAGEIQEAAAGQLLTAHDRERLDACTAAIGRTVSALIACTGQNPRKGVCGTIDEMTSEVADAVCAGLFAIQHFTKDAELTAGIVEAGLLKAFSRATGTSS